METRVSTWTRFSVLPVFIALIFNLMAPLVPSVASPTVALTGSSFDATDGNLTVEGGETDWCTPAPNLVTKSDTASGATDTSFSGANNKEDTDVPNLGLGTIPSNKDDLLREYIASETVNGDLFVYLAWVRADPTGTSTIDFEFNQSDVVSSNGTTKVRTDGDLLITFDFQANPGSQGGYAVNLEVRTWSSSATDQPDPTSPVANTGAWINPVDLDASGLGEGSVNFFEDAEGDPVAISDCINGGTIDNGEFGEASLNLTDILGGACRAFGSVFAKSRSSNAFSADLKDRIDPAPVDFSTCGQLTIIKTDASGTALGGATFSISPNPFGGAPDPLPVTDNVAPDDNLADGVIHLSDVEPGTYEVCETVPPAGYIGASACQELVLAANGAISFTFVNTLGAIDWVKVDEQTGTKICCATFLLEGTAGAADGFSLQVTDNDGVTDADGDPGEIQVTGLKLGTYTITEISPPEGYDLPALADRTQVVVLDDESASAGFAFEDPPQADAGIEKDAVLSPIIAGAAASFDIIVTAGGTGTSEDVVLTDLNETDHSWSITGDDAADCGSLPLTIDPDDTLTCDFGDLANGETRTITISMTSDADDCELGIANTASIASTNDHDESNNEDSASIEIQCPNPGVTKVAKSTPIVFGEDAVFDITVTAGGTGPATNVELTDLNETGHTWAISGDDAAACGTLPLSIADGETLTCNWAEIPAGESRTVTITMTSGAEDCELDIANTASITADADVDESNNEDSASIAVLCPDPSVQKSANATTITADGEASFDIVVAAGGTGNSLGVVLTDVNETDHAWSVTGPDASACGTLPLTIDPGETLTCDFGMIPNGQDRTITITLTSSEDDCALGIDNTASITADADVDESNNEDSASIEVLCPDLELVKDGSDPVSAGDDVFFTLTVTNHGDGTAKSVLLTDNLPGDGLATWFIDSTENIDENDCGITADVLTCTIDELGSGDWFSVTVKTSTDPDACPSVWNDADVVLDNEDPNGQYPNEDSYTITVDCPDLEVVKEQVDENGNATSEPVAAGDTGYFEVHVTNSGDGNAYGVELFDAPDTGTWTVLDDGGLTCPAEIGAGGATCTADVLAPGTYTVFLSYVTDVPDCGQILNEVVVSADNEPVEWVNELNSDSASIIVECPGLNIIKRQVDENGDPTDEPILAGDTAYFEILVWNSDDEGIGTAHGVVVTENAEDLPDGVSWSIDAPEGVSCASSVSTEEPQSFTCNLGDLDPGDEVSIIVSGVTDRADCGALVNTARVDATNNDDEVPPATATILVSCPEIALDKENDAVGSVLPGTTVEYTLTLTVNDEGLENGEATDVVVIDEMPIGLEDPTDISDDGDFDPATRTITWDLGDLGEGTYTLSYLAVVADDVENGEELVNAAAATSTNSQCPDFETLGPECEDDSTVIVRVPTLVIDKVADVEVITISGPSDDLVADPSVVTWTLTYTLTNGPVTNAVITDEVPEGFEFLDASAGGTLVDGVVTWTFATLSESGSVTFRTTVDPETISRVAPTVNVAVIDSDETEPDEGQDSVTVVVEPPPQGGTPTPKPSLPNTAAGFGVNGEPITVPVELLVAFFIGSLGAMALANVKARSRRR